MRESLIVSITTLGMLLASGCATTKPSKCECDCAAEVARAVRAVREARARGIATKDTAAQQGVASNRVTGMGGSAGGEAGLPFAHRRAGADDARKRVKLQLYVMSKCPFGVQAMQAVTRAMTALKGAVELRVDYIVSEDGSGQLKAMHGDPELRGNILQLCAQHLFPTAAFLEFVDCQNKNWRQIPTNWERCARAAGIDTNRLGACYTSPAGQRLLRASMRRAKAQNATGSPTIFVAGKTYHGARHKRDFMRALCGAFSADADRPAECGTIPPPVQVHATLLTDKRCKTCSTTGLITNLRQRFFPSLTVRELDYGTPEGKRLFRQLGLKHLPALLFDPGVEQAAKWSTIARWMIHKGGYRKLRIPASFDPKAEICDNGKDDTGNGRVDCADATCRLTLGCRPVKKRHLAVFIMSQCPYGVRGLDAMQEVLKNFKGRLTFDIHYIADEQDDGSFNALHGQPEVEENIRHLCAKRYYRRRNKYLDYIWCRNRNYRSDDWKPCAKGGISARVIERCARGKLGRRLLSRDIRVAKALKISGSPTWLANNRHKFSGITAEAIKTEVCKHNPRLPGCQNTLGETSGGAGGSCDSK
jgi:hypothetical protein